MNGAGLRVVAALVSATWREKLSRPITVILCAFLCVSQLGLAAASGSLQDPVLILTLLLTSGSVGRELSSGVLALLFTRPLRRSTYILSKWIAAASAAAILSTLTLVVEALWLAHKGAALPGMDVFSAVFESITTACGIASVLVFFSVLLPGIGDVALWGILSLVGFLLQRNFPLVSEQWHAVLQPVLGWSSTFQAKPIAWFSLFSYLSTLTLCLCLAAMAANRKEISYASG